MPIAANADYILNMVKTDFQNDLNKGQKLRFIV